MPRSSTKVLVNCDAAPVLSVIIHGLVKKALGPIDT